MQIRKNAGLIQDCPNMVSRIFPSPLLTSSGQATGVAAGDLSEIVTSGQAAGASRAAGSQAPRAQGDCPRCVTQGELARTAESIMSRVTLVILTNSPIAQTSSDKIAEFTKQKLQTDSGTAASIKAVRLKLDKLSNLST